MRQNRMLIPRPLIVLTAWLMIAVPCVSQEKIVYPYPVQHLQLQVENKPVNMAYMDVSPAKPNGKAVLLLHGKNFNGYYWKDVIAFLSEKGFRVVVPDQVGWGQSDRPDIHYSFHLLAFNTKKLLDSLKLARIIVIGHSMGGMLAARFTLLFPGMVEKLVLEDPIGLEDYRRSVPYQPVELQYAKELKATYADYKKYQQTYYPEWKPEYEQYVQAQATDLGRSDFKSVAWANALTYQMIYEQPVCYEWDSIKVPVLLITGSADRTVVGKELLPAEKKDAFGNYPELGKKTKLHLPSATLIELPGVGHIPHVQRPDLFKQAVLAFLK